MSLKIYLNFYDLHSEDTEHAGILAVYQDNDPARDMSYHDIVQAIANLEASVRASGLSIAGSFWSLNAYRW